MPFTLDLFFQAFKITGPGANMGSRSHPGLLKEVYCKGQGKLYFPSDGSHTDIGFVQKEGLSTEGYVVELAGTNLSGFVKDFEIGNSFLPSTNNILHEISARFLKHYNWGAIVRPVENDGSNGSKKNTPISQNRDEPNGLLVAVLGSNCKEENRQWTRRGIYEWKQENMRYFPAEREKMKRILIVRIRGLKGLGEIFSNIK